MYIFDLRKHIPLYEHVCLLHIDIIKIFGWTSLQLRLAICKSKLIVVWDLHKQKDLGN